MNALGRGKQCVYGGIDSMCMLVCAWLAVISTPSPKQGPPTILIGWEVEWEGCQGEGAAREGEIDRGRGL